MYGKRRDLEQRDQIPVGLGDRIQGSVRIDLGDRFQLMRNIGREGGKK